SHAVRAAKPQVQARPFANLACVGSAGWNPVVFRSGILSIASIATVRSMEDPLPNPYEEDLAGSASMTQRQSGAHAIVSRAILAQTPARSSGLSNTMRVVLACLLATAAAASLLEDLSEQLGAERASAVERRALPLEAVLRPILQALPKSGSGNCLGAAAARYALHRVFVQERGWFVKGLQELDPSRVVANASTVVASPVAILQDQVPEAVKSLFEVPLRQEGLCLRELAVLAALLEDLVHRETMQRVGSAFKAHHVPLVGRVTVERVTAMLEYVMMSYILEVASLDGTNLVADDAKAYLEGRLPMEDVYPSWPKTQKFIRDIQEVVAPSQKGSLSFEDVTHIVEEINEHYGRWHDESDCADMKGVLLNMEGKCPGRVDLSRFYAASLYEDRWQFSESVHYLRDLGALDESQPESSVIVSNYVLGASNCVGTSRFYAQCCVDPCDQLLAQLEKALAAPRASASDLKAALAALPAPDSTVRPPLEDLQKASTDGLVALHGRLFAQWLHHAYPRQCPMPARAGMRLWQELPRDFTLRTGQDYAATHEEMKRYADQKRSKEGVCRLPWISEELLVSEMPATASVVPPDVAHSLKAVLDSGVAKTLCLVGFALVAMVVGMGVARRRVRASARGPLLATEAPEAVQPASCEELSALSWPDEFFRPQAACRFNRMEDTPLIMVRTEEELKEMVEEIKGTCIGQEIAVDVEHHDFRSFRGFVCLIQVSTRKKDFLIDPFDIFEQLHMLNEVFSDPRIVKVLHGADRDVLWLQRDFSIYLVNMFDTGLATRALRLQGTAGFGLSLVVNSRDRPFSDPQPRTLKLPFDVLDASSRSGFASAWLQGKDMDDWSTDPVAAPVQTELHAIESGSGGLGHHVSAPLESPGKAQGPGDCNGAEVQRLREENAMLRAQVRELQVVLATGVLTEIARLREENEELQLKSAVVAESWIGKGWKGPAALLQAPYDLFLVFSIKAAEITAYYGFSYIFVSYVSDEYGMSDEEAGRLYGAYGFACTGVGLLLGFLIDRLGVRRSMLLGCTCSTLYRAICALASSRQLMWFSTMTFAPVGAAFGVPVLALAVRRYTHRENRAFAFSFFYSMLCLGCLLGSVLINIVRDVLVDGTVVLGVKLSWMRMVLWMCTACTFYTVIASLFVRDIQILSDMPLKDREYCKFKPANFQVRQTVKEIMGQAKFWRLAGITGIFIGVRMTFRHLDATFPKYFIRTYGPQAPFEIILGINPIVEMIGTPLMTGLLLKWNTTLSQKLLWGSFISGISVFALAIWESYLGAVVFVLVLSLGDTIWSPTLYEFSTMAATEGKEGMFLAITMAPMYLAALPVGLISGWALGNFCPQNVNPEERRSQLMWFIIGITGFVSPVALWFFQKKLILPEDENAGEKELERDEGEGEYRQTRRLRDAGDAVGQSPASTLQEGTTLVIGRPLPDEVVPEDMALK
ncbi:RRP6, partial [Symbiodinium microadriaticum]